jgi:polyisoprenoid-binding protein YceI
MIHYQLIELKVSAASSNKADCIAQGRLTVAGVTNTITMPVTVERLEGHRIKVSGAIPLKMTAFNIKPPEPVGFFIKTGDEVRISFDWLLAPKRGE